MKTVGIILGGGSGQRFGSQTPKQYCKVSGKLVIEHTIEIFERNEKIDETYLVVPKEYFEQTEELVIKNSYHKVKKILIGGSTRQESSKIGIFACDIDVSKVLIHDAVRPFIDDRVINQIIDELDHSEAVDIAIPTSDTIIQVKNGIITDIPERKWLYRGQTPQGFSTAIIKKAHQLADLQGYNSAPDDCSLILRYQLANVTVIDGSESNLKITYPIDLFIADKLFQLNKIGIPNIKSKEIESSLQGKVVVVFGGSSGIGKDIVDIANRMGCYAYSFSRANGVDITNIQAVQDSLDKVYAKHRSIDHVICTAGIMKRGTIETISIQDIDEQIGVNLVGPLYIAKLSIPYLKKSYGSLTYFSSSSYTRGRSSYVPYSSSKAAIVNMVQGLSEELRYSNIRVNVVCPERTATPLRQRNFGKEDKKSLLSSDYVAISTLKVIASSVTGSIIDIKKIDEIKERDNKSNLTY